MSLKAIKSKIKATERTGKVTKAMEAVSAVKMRKSQERAFGARPYAQAALRILTRVSASRDAQNHSFTVAGKGTKDCVIIITSDKGLAGSLNAAVLKEATLLLQNKKKEEVSLICFGKKGFEHFQRRGYEVAQHYLNVSDEITLADMQEIVAYVTKAFAADTYKSVTAIYQSFVSTFEQDAVVRELLPLKKEVLEQMVADIVPKKGKFSEYVESETPSVYTIEPSPDAVLDILFPQLVQVMMYHAMLESKASEHSARMVAMKNATDKAKDVAKILTRTFNRKRQSVITAEVSEITGGIEAMKEN